MNINDSRHFDWCHTKPVAESLTLLEQKNRLLYVEGSTAGTFHLLPFSVKYIDAEGKIQYVCARRKLHQIARELSRLTPRKEPDADRNQIHV